MKPIKINRVAAFVVLIYPLIIGTLAWVYARKYGLGTFEITCVIASFYTFCISVGVGIHRLWAHGSYKAHKAVEWILSVISAGTLQGPILAWASDHDRHHSYTDVLGKDPHTPLKYALLEEGQNEYATKGKFKGFLWSHIGWMLDGSRATKQIEKSTVVRLGKNKIVMWQYRHYWKIAILVNTLVPFSIGYAIGGTLHYAIAGFIFIGLGRAIQQQATFCINSLVHFFGSKKYLNSTAGDIPALFFIFLGENWHNFHHAFPRDYRNGHKWYHLDGHKWIIALLEKLGLATDLIRTPDIRIQAKVDLTRQQFMTNLKTQLKRTDMTLRTLSEALTKKIELDFKNANITLQTQLMNLKQKVSLLIEKLTTFINDSDIIRPKEVNRMQAMLKRLERDFAFLTMQREG